MKKITFAYFLLATVFALFNACEKEALAPPPQPISEEKDAVVEFTGDLLTIGDLLEIAGDDLIGYLDDTEKILFANFEYLETLKAQFLPLKTSEYVWVIEKNGHKYEYFLAPLMELNPDKTIKDEDEITRKNEYCKKVTECFYGRTSKSHYRFPKDPPTACVVRKDEVCTGKKKTFEVEVHSDNNCVTPEKDENGEIILKEITILVCSR